MRIVAGSAKGTRLAPVPPGTRPVSDRAREGVFSSLGDRVAGARVLDLFAGTGALGIEALSRGASGATFVERSRAAAQAITKNLELTHLQDGASLITTDVAAYLRTPPPAAFDLVFCDPPYEMGSPELDEILQGLATSHLAEGFTVVLTRDKRSSTPVIPLQWVPARSLQYGGSLVTQYREVRWA